MESDEKLIKRISRGDLEAFETLYYRYRDWVYRLAYRFTRDHELAQDVLQETFIYLLKKFPGLELTVRMTTFLYPTVKFTSLNMLRLRQRDTEQYEAFDLISIPAATESNPSADNLAAVLALLPDAQREVVLMRFVDGFTVDEITDALGIPVGTVKSRLHNALKALRENPKTRQYFTD